MPPRKPPAFHRPRQIEAEYLRKLEKLLGGWLHFPVVDTLEAAFGYLEELGAWDDPPETERLVSSMATMVARTDANNWRQAAAQSSNGRRIHEMLRNSLRGEVGRVMRENVAAHASKIKSVPQELAQEAANHIAKRQMKGERAEVIMRDLRDKMPGLARYKLDMLARTQVASTASAITEARATSINLLWYIWDTSGDARVRPSHRNMDLVLVRFKEPPAPEALIGIKSTLGHYNAGQCPNCFTGDTKIGRMNGLKRLWRAPYSGDLVSLTVGIETIRVTPNHPILTLDGWKAAGKINIGDYLIQARGDAHGVFESDEDHELPSFDKLFEANASFAKVLPAFGFDFYGDIPDGDVYQITFDDVLSDHNVTARYEGGYHLPLTITDGGVWFSRESAFPHVGGSLLSSPGESKAPVLDRSRSHSDFHGLARGTHNNAAFLQALYDCESVNSEIVRKTGCGLPTDISLDNSFDGKRDQVGGSPSLAGDFYSPNPESLAKDVRINSDLLSYFTQPHCSYKPCRVINKSLGSFTGHVYTIQSDNGWYGVTSSSIIAKNCRCDENVLVDLDQVSWPCRVYYNGKISRMSRKAFEKIM